jgi:uroporphyrinogen-III synthase
MSSHVQRFKNVVITRSNRGNVELAERLRSLGFNPLAVDTITFLPPNDWSGIDGSLRALSTYTWVVFTSATGVEFFAERMVALSLKVPWDGPPMAAAVGEGTAGALSRYGVRDAFIPSTYLTRNLAQELPFVPGSRVLLLRADIADPEMPKTMRRRGFEVDALPIYRTCPSDGGKQRLTERADVIEFASPSSVEGFCRKMDSDELESLKSVPAACIGPVTARAATRRGFKKVVLAKSQTFDSLLEAIGDEFR